MDRKAKCGSSRWSLQVRKALGTGYAPWLIRRSARSPIFACADCRARSAQRYSCVRPSPLKYFLHLTASVGVRSHGSRRPDVVSAGRLARYNHSRGSARVFPSDLAYGSRSATHHPFVTRVGAAPAAFVRIYTGCGVCVGPRDRDDRGDGAQKRKHRLNLWPRLRRRSLRLKKRQRRRLWQ